MDDIMVVGLRRTFVDSEKNKRGKIIVLCMYEPLIQIYDFIALILKPASNLKSNHGALSAKR